MIHRNLSIAQRADGTLVMKDIGDPMEFYAGTKRHFEERRPVKQGAHGTYPETTNGEVRQLAKAWSRLRAQNWRKDLADVAGHRDEWKVALTHVAVATTYTDPDATFPYNERFWTRWARRQGIYLGAMRGMPSTWDLVVDSVKDSATHLPENLGKGAVAIVDASASVGRKAGAIAASSLRGLLAGLFGGLGKPLLIGAIVVGGILIVPKLLPTPAPDALPPAGGSS